VTPMSSTAVEFVSSSVPFLFFGSVRPCKNGSMLLRLGPSSFGRAELAKLLRGTGTSSSSWYVTFYYYCPCNNSTSSTASHK
jgi:hypothetical protein